jgi:predicted component of type VI protein secretion system
MDAYLALSDGTRVPVRDGLLIGRVSACDVMIDDSKCSRRHARLIAEGGVVEIEDLGSSNGTLLNGKPVERRMLRSGDEIQIGKTVLRYVEGVATAPPPTEIGAMPQPAARPAAEDDVDLFGGGPVRPATPPAPGPAVPPPPAAPPAAPSPALARPVTVQIPPRQEPPARTGTVVEFEDEIVAVRKPAASTPATPAPPVAPGDIVRQQRLLQFHKVEDKGGLFGVDVSQMAGRNRLLAILLIAVVAGGLFWLAMTLMG